MPNLGYDQIGTSQQGMGPWLSASRFNLPVDGTITELVAYIGTTAATNCMIIIYNAAGAIVYQTPEIPAVIGGWTIHVLPTPLALPAGDYWLAAWTPAYGGRYLPFDLTGPALESGWYNNVTYPAVPTNLFADWRTNAPDIRSYSIYAVYTTGPPPPNEPPVANFSYAPVAPTVGQNVQFTDLSDDPNGVETIASWIWNFGDGATSTLQNPTHNYAADGSYVVTLTVTDNGGLTDTIQQIITVYSIPPELITGITPFTVDLDPGTYSVEIEPVTPLGAGFVRWSDGDTANPRIVTIIAEVTTSLVAEYETRILTILADPDGLGISPEPGTYVYEKGTQTLLIIATPSDPSNVFDYWSINPIPPGFNDKDPSIVLTMDENYTLQPHFKALPVTSGKLSVIAYLGATEIIADGLIVETAEAFKTPLIDKELPEGRYTIRVSLDNWVSYQEKAVDIIAGEPSSLEFNFAPTPTIPFPLMVVPPTLIGLALVYGAVG